MTISECFHYPFYMGLINGYENPDEKKTAVLKKGGDETKLVIPRCALEYFISEDLLTFAIVSSQCYVASMKILQQRIKPLAKPRLEQREELSQHPRYAFKLQLLKSRSSSEGTDQARITEFANSTPIRGLINPLLAALEYERTLSFFPDLLKRTYRESIKFIGENNYSLFEDDEAKNFYAYKMHINHPLLSAKSEENSKDQLLIDEVD